MGKSFYGVFGTMVQVAVSFFSIKNTPTFGEDEPGSTITYMLMVFSGGRDSFSGGIHTEKRGLPDLYVF